MGAFNRLQKVRRRLDEDAFRPSSVIERLVLQVIGGWELVKAEVAFHSFAAAGSDAQWRPDGNPAEAVLKIAKALRVRHPHEEFRDAAQEANAVRRRFAHLLALGDIVGEWPERTLQFMRRGEPGESYGKLRERIGLKWRDQQWAQQVFHQDSISEQDLHKTLAQERWLIQVCRGIDHLGARLAESPDLADDRKISDGEWWSVYTPNSWWIPWVLPEWHRDKRTTLYVRDVRLPADDSVGDVGEVVKP
jgi:hypothetical protein